jgi:protein TonB
LPVETSPPVEAPKSIVEEAPLPVTPPLEVKATNENVAAPAGEVFGADPVDRVDLRARVIEEPEPIFPPEALSRKIQYAQVVVEVVVTREGDVIRPRIVKGADLFNEAAMATAVKYKFRPARLRGQPVASRVEIVINFDLR